MSGLAITLDRSVMPPYADDREKHIRDLSAEIRRLKSAIKQMKDLHAEEILEGCYRLGEEAYRVFNICIECEGSGTTAGREFADGEFEEVPCSHCGGNGKYHG